MAMRPLEAALWLVGIALIPVFFGVHACWISPATKTGTDRTDSPSPWMITSS